MKRHRMTKRQNKSLSAVVPVSIRLMVQCSAAVAVFGYDVS